MSSKNYICGQEETFGSIAWREYGTMAGIDILIKANTSVPIDSIFPSGTVLIIPIIEKTDNSVLIKNMPPWK